ncbi:hypothetical protein, partial [Lactobacillus amylovorus]
NMLLSIFSDGNWLFPLLVLLALLGTGEYIAKKKNMPKIDKIINITGYVVMIGLLIIYWIWYFVTPKDVSLYNVLLVTLLTFYIVSDKVLEHFKDRLKSKYEKLKVTISTIYILLIVALIFVGSRFF